MSEPVRWQGQPSPARQQSSSGGGDSLADILERVLDKGIVIAGDIQVNLLDIELLTIKIRLVVASVDKAKEMGIDWWERDPTLSSGQRELEDENQRLRDRLAALENGAGAVGAPDDVDDAEIEAASDDPESDDTESDDTEPDDTGSRATDPDDTGSESEARSEPVRRPARRRSTTR